MKWYIKNEASKTAHVFQQGKYSAQGYSHKICNIGTTYRLDQIIEVSIDEYELCLKCSRIVADKISQKIKGENKQSPYIKELDEP